MQNATIEKLRANACALLTKERVAELKANGGSCLADLAKDNAENPSALVFILENLGHLPASFDASWIAPLLCHKSEAVRLLAAKNIGKIKEPSNLELLERVATEDESSMVRREAVSAIGRMRSEKAIPFLVATLADSDPKIVCQAIRGLLVFKGNKDIDSALTALASHENEIVQNVIQKEYFAKAERKAPSLSHAETYPFLKDVSVNGDVRDVLELVPDESVHLTFTSPPYYNARDYSIYPSYEAYLDFLEEVFAAVHRVTKEGRFLIVNTSPVIVPRITRAHASKRYPIPFDLHARLARIGWDFIDDIVWEKPEFSVKNRIGGFQQHRKPLAYKPNAVTEYLMVYRKHTDRLLDWNIHQYDEETVEESKVPDGFETTNVWRICPKSDKVHSAIFPPELCKRVVEYYSYKGDLVFDPFAGSGTLGRTAKGLGRHFFLTEKEPKYFEYMKSFQPGDELFGGGENARFLALDEFREECRRF